MATKEELQKRLDQYRLALESLTPGGSEFYNDLERCVAYVREARQNQHEMIIRLKLENDQLKTDLAQIDIAREYFEWKKDQKAADSMEASQYYYEEYNRLRKKLEEVNELLKISEASHLKNLEDIFLKSIPLIQFVLAQSEELEAAKEELEAMKIAALEGGVKRNA